MSAVDEFTEPLVNGSRFKHGSELRFQVRSGGEILEDRLVPVLDLSAALTVAGFTYNRLSFSGGVEWWHPGTGGRLERPKVRLFVRPADVLSGDEECDCARCQQLGGGS